MRIALGADDATPLVSAIADYLAAAGHEVRRFGKAAGVAEPWGTTGRDVGRAVARGEHELGVVCCFTGTGVSMAANKVPGVRAALCVDAETARGARKWNDANVLALSLRLTSEDAATQILAAFLSEPYTGEEVESLAILAALDERAAES